MNTPKEASKDMTMAEAISPRRMMAALLGASALGVALAGTIALWVHYGTAVFFETIRTGLVACFG